MWSGLEWKLVSILKISQKNYLSTCEAELFFISEIFKDINLLSVNLLSKLNC